MNEPQMHLMYLAPSWFQLLIIVALIVLLFGRGKVSELMGDVAKGIKNFRKGLSDEDEAAKAEPPKSLEHTSPLKNDSRTGAETRSS